MSIFKKAAAMPIVKTVVSQGIESESKFKTGDRVLVKGRYPGTVEKVSYDAGSPHYWIIWDNDAAPSQRFPEFDLSDDSDWSKKQNKKIDTSWEAEYLKNELDAQPRPWESMGR